MYSRKSWGGAVDPFILVKFMNQPDIGDADPLASIVIFEWQDEDLIGILPDDAKSYRDKETICDANNVARNFCTEEQLGTFILSQNATDNAANPIYTEAIHLKEPKVVNYPIRRTGYYCVSTYAFSDHKYDAVVEWRSAFGELPAAQIAKLPFYGGLTIVYAVLGIFWGFLYVQNRSDILPVQNYITATIVFLIIEQLLTWGFYDYQNRNGNTAGNKVFLVVVAILNAGRISLSFFLLLIVCMGYGVVKPTLGRTMIYVRILAIVHFVFGVIYAIASLAVTPDTVGPIVLFVIMPLAGTLTAFYVWTLSSLNATMKDLIDRKQKTKALMYKRLWWCLLGSIMVIFGFFFVNSFAFAGSSEIDFIPNHWQTRWFILDGWLNIVYLFDVAFIAYLWRPTANNRRFAMSEEVSSCVLFVSEYLLTLLQLAQDDDGFEIRSIHSRDSLDDLDSPDGDPRKNKNDDLDLERAAFGGHSSTSGGGLGGMGSVGNPAERSRSPNPTTAAVGSAIGGAAAKETGTRLPRESLDGETIFAVGDEDDDWNEGEPEEEGGEGDKMMKRS